MIILHITFFRDYDVLKRNKSENKNPRLPQILTVEVLCGDYLYLRQFHYVASIQDEDRNATNISFYQYSKESSFQVSF